VEGKVKATALAKVIQDEMLPAFQPLVKRGVLSSFIVEDLLRRLV
jgi:hypothetical protein